MQVKKKKERGEKSLTDEMIPWAGWSWSKSAVSLLDHPFGPNNAIWSRPNGSSLQDGCVVPGVGRSRVSFQKTGR